MAPELTAETLGELLRDPACPFSAIPSRRPVRLIALRDLADFARRQLGDLSDLEDRLDRLMVAEMDAKRLPFVDPWSWPLRMVKKLLGIPTPRMVAYEVPEARVGPAQPPRLGDITHIP